MTVVGISPCSIVNTMNSVHAVKPDRYDSKNNQTIEYKSVRRKQQCLTIDTTDLIGL